MTNTKTIKDYHIAFIPELSYSILLYDIVEEIQDDTDKSIKR